jgi:hypothetical protein
VRVEAAGARGGERQAQGDRALANAALAGHEEQPLGQRLGDGDVRCALGQRDAEQVMARR